jgi:hypothetical protein
MNAAGGRCLPPHRRKASFYKISYTVPLISSHYKIGLRLGEGREKTRQDMLELLRYIYSLKLETYRMTEGRGSLRV